MTMEETRRKNEASMARKRANVKALNPAAANSGIGTQEGALSPSSTGAMDSLLEKLRAAAPQARDQRDRRRRARLKDKHQVRIASGQKIPELGDLSKNDGEEGEEGERLLLSPDNANNDDPISDRMEPISEGEDVAERAASMLQGLRGDNSNSHELENGRPASRDGSGSLRVRRRRESADDERRNRRRRRARESSSTAADDDPRSPPPGNDEETIQEEGDSTIIEESEENVPMTVVSPPSPEGGAKRPIVLDDD